MGYYMNMTDCSFTVKAENRIKVESLLNEIRFEPEFDSAGNIVSIDFAGEKLWEQFDKLKQIAAYVEDGSYIEVRGEDGAMWRWVFKNQECREICAVVTWPDE